MKRIWKHVAVLIALLLCMATIPTGARAADFPDIRLNWDFNLRSVIISRVPIYDDTGSVRYALEGGLFFGQEQLESFRYVPEDKSYDMPERQGYLLNMDDRQIPSGTYTIRAQLVAQDRQNPGTVIGKGPVQEFSFEYIKTGDAPPAEVDPSAPKEPGEMPPPNDEPPPPKEPGEIPPPHDEPPPPEWDPSWVVDLCLDANGGTFRNALGMTLYDASMPVKPDTTLAADGYTIDRITCAGKTFQGWIAYDATTNTPLSGLLTTNEVLNYTIPRHSIRFVIQWEALTAEPITAITYAALYNGTGQPDYNVRVTLEANGVRYSGNGFVTISKDIYSKWTGNVKVIWECPGEYISANNLWVRDYFESECPAKSFAKEGNCYISISKTGKEQDNPGPQDVVDDFFYSVRNEQPETSPVKQEPKPEPLPKPVPEPEQQPTPGDPTETVTLPTGHTVVMQQLRSGSTYDAAMVALQKSAGTSHALLFDITAKDVAGTPVHQMDNTAEIKIQLPAEYVIQSGNTAVVYYLPGDGTAVPCETTYYDEDPANRYLIFKTNHFSLYAVAEVAKQSEAPVQPVEPEIPETPLVPTVPDAPAQPEAPTAPDTPAAPNLPILAGLALVAVAIIAVVVVFLKKRRG